MKPQKKRPGATEPRFRIEKLEERIAPKKGGVPGNCTGDYGFGRYNPQGNRVGSWRCRII